MSDIFTSTEITYKDIELYATTAPIPAESTNLDFKREFCDSLFHTIAAMANTEGGIILVGFDQKRKSGINEISWPPVGIGGDPIRNNILSSKCHEFLRPDYVPDFIKYIEIPDVEDKYIIFIRIDPKKARRPIWHKHKGILIRMESQNKCADLDTIRRLLSTPETLSASDISYRQQVNGVRNANLNGTWLSVVAQVESGRDFLVSQDKLSLIDLVYKYLDIVITKNPIIYSTRKNVRILLPTRENPDKIFSFNSDGIISIQVLNPAETINIGWILNYLFGALTLLSNKKLNTVYGDIENKDITVCLSNWPNKGFDTSGYFSAITTPYSLNGYSLLQEYILSADTKFWDLAKDFCGIVLGEAGFLNYEELLNSLPQGL